MSNRHQTKKNSASSSAPKKRPAARKQNPPWLWIGLGAAAIAAAAFLLLRPKTPAPAEISVYQAFSKYEQGAFLVDVRTQEEWDQVKIPNTTLIPLDELKNRLDELPRDGEMVVVCRSGNRSDEAMKILTKAGFTNAVGMDGGIKAWGAARYPLDGSLE